MLRRRSAIQRVVRDEWGGSYADSQTYAKLFRDYHPTDFGMMDAREYSSELNAEMINKPWIWLTMAQGHVMSVEPGHDDYRFRLKEDVEADAYITRVDPNLPAQPGKGNSRFKVYADKPYFHDPVLLKVDANDAPRLRVIGHPASAGLDEWEYLVELQDGDPNAWINPEYLQPGRRLIDGGTSIANELNDKYGGDYYANHYELSSHIGYVARKIEMTDRFIRLVSKNQNTGALGYSMSGSSDTYGDNGIGVGYVLQPSLSDKTGSSVVTSNTFITMAEARLSERLMEDKNMGMELGRTEVTYHHESKRILKVPPGWRQIRRDGYYYPHNGSLTLKDIYDKINSITNVKRGVGESVYVLRTGKGGIEMFNYMVKNENNSNPLTLVDSFFISRDDTNITPNGLKYGAQFTSALMPNGITLTVMYDPTKDNPRYYPEKLEGTSYSKESFTFDILDIGETDAAPKNARTRSNIAMVWEEAYESYFMRSNVYDLYSGAVNNGSNVATLDKEAGIYRESSYALAVWDTSRILSMPFE